jgi:MFS family permease
MRVPRLRAGGRRVFGSLGVPNYRRFFIGQVISRAGTWMQRFAQSWLVFELTKSATFVGVVVALQAVPTLIVGPYAGVIADRFDKRRIMIGLQSMMGVLALVLGLLTVTHVVRLWEIVVLAVLLGANEAFENPARQAFVFEMVGAEQLPNAIGLNSVLNNIARALGPAIGAGFVAAFGLGTCFLANAVSFAAVIASLVMVDRRALHPVHLAPRARGQLREGVAYVRRSPDLWVPLAMMMLIGTLAWEFQTVLPPMASKVLHGGASAFGLMVAAQGVGAIAGGLLVAARRRTGRRALIVQAACFGVAMALVAIAPNLPTAIAFMLLVGFTATSFSATGNTTVQLNSESHMRGRVLSLWVVAFQGSTPIGGPIAGYVASAAGARAALGMGALACFGAAGLGIFVAARRGREVSRIRPDEAPPPLQIEPDSP